MFDESNFQAILPLKLDSHPNSNLLTFNFMSSWKIFEFVQDNERAKAVSQAEALAMRSSQSQANPWGTITRAKCTCTCHHHQFADGGPSRPGSAATTTSDRCSTPSAIRPPETTQNMADISVVDISLWRDNRTGKSYTYLHTVIFIVSIKLLPQACSYFVSQSSYSIEQSCPALAHPKVKWNWTFVD